MRQIFLTIYEVQYYDITYLALQELLESVLPVPGLASSERHRPSFLRPKYSL